MAVATHEARRVIEVEDPAASSPFRDLFRWGGIAAAGAAVLTPISVGAFAASPPPGYDEGARVWFDHIKDNEFLGFLSLDLPFLLISALMVPVMLALLVALRHVRPAHVLVAGTLYLVAIATYFGTNTSLEMMFLSDRFAEATTEAERIALLGAGEAAIGAFNSTAFHANYILAQTAGIVLGFVMLNDTLFPRRIAYLMIVGNAVGFGLYLPVIGLGLSAFSGVVLWIWMIMVARRLLQLGHGESWAGS